MRVGAPGSGNHRTERVNFSNEEQIEIAIHCMKIAIAFHNQKNTELLETAVKSGDMNHRIAAAWAFGLQAIPQSDQSKLVANFIRTQAVRIQSILAQRSRVATRFVDPRLLNLLASLNNMPSVEATEPKPYSNCLLLLMRDANPLVSSAARDSCVAIASRTYNDRYVDFGPMFNAQNAAKDDSALLWEIYFEKKFKGNSEEQPVPKPQTNHDEEKKEAG